jgi:hypothetical protein
MSAIAVGAAVAGGVASAAVGSAMGGGGGGSQQGAAAADPFAAQRPQYQDMLQQLMTGNFTPTDPSYAWRFGQGMEAVNRQQAAAGNLNSGTRWAALADYGQGQASTEYANQFSRLSQLAGANVGSPAAAGQIIAGQGQSNQQAGAAFGNVVSQAVNAWGNQSSAAPGWAGSGPAVDTSGGYGFGGAVSPVTGMPGGPSYGGGVSYGGWF